MWLDSEYCLVVDTDVELLALSRTGLQAVPGRGGRAARGRIWMLQDVARGYKSAYLILG